MTTFNWCFIQVHMALTLLLAYNAHTVSVCSLVLAAGLNRRYANERVTFGIHFSRTERFLRWSVKILQSMGSA